MESLANPGLTIALALAAGVVAQSVARHIRVPGIVLLLLLGVVLGPSVIGLIWPQSLQGGLATLVEFAVAVILFEGGMNLDVKRIRREHRPIRRLITIGAFTTAAGGTLIAALCLGWGWRTSALFGALVIVTGPTVINPLLRRLRVERSVATILEAEGVLGDGIGALTAAVALEIAVRPLGANVAYGPFDLLGMLAFGLALGCSAGLLLGRLLRLRSVVPDGLQNIFILSFILAVFQGANAIMHDTGIPAVIGAGVVIGNFERTRVHHELFEFKEQLTVMLIGLLFILLAADVDLKDVYDLGLGGALAVTLLLVVLRPLTVFASTWRSGLSWRQKAFMSWIGPRGIVAAAVASLCATRLAESGYADGQQLRAMVFLVVAVSVLSAGVMGGLVGRLLGVRRESEGWVILGANALARELAGCLQRAGQEVVCIDTNTTSCAVAHDAGIPVLPGNGLEERTVERARVEHRLGALAVTSNDAANYLFIKRAIEAGPPRLLAAAMGYNARGARADVGRDLGAEILFGHTQDVSLWEARLRLGGAVREAWAPAKGDRGTQPALESGPGSLVLFLAVDRGGEVTPVMSGLRFRAGDVAHLLLDGAHLVDAHRWLEDQGWRPSPETPAIARLA